MPFNYFADGHVEETEPGATLLPLLASGAENGKFSLQRHWYRGPVIIRFGPSQEHYDLRLILPDGSRESFLLKDDPRGDRSVSAFQLAGADHPKLTLADGRTLDAFALVGRVALKPEPGKPDAANPTKDTPAWVETLARGPFRVLEDSPDFKKFEFAGRGFRGLYTLRREAPGSEFWQFDPSAGPELSKAGPSTGANKVKLPPAGEREAEEFVPALPAPTDLGYGTTAVPTPRVQLAPGGNHGGTPSSAPQAVEKPDQVPPAAVEAEKQVQALLDLAHAFGYEIVDPRTGKPVTAGSPDSEGPEGAEPVTKTVRLFKADRLQQIVYGVVMEPDEVDTQGHFATAADISDACHYYATNWLLIDEEHARVVPRTEAVPVELFIAPVDIEWPIDDQGNVEVVRQGSWVQATKILSPALWQKYESGELNAYSIRGWGRIKDGSHG